MSTYNLTGLKFFKPDPTYLVDSRLDRFEKPERVIMVTSKETRQSYIKYGGFTFEFQRKKLQLFAYKSAEEPYNRSFSFPFQTSHPAVRPLELGD